MTPQQIMARAHTLREEAVTLGYDRYKRAWEQPKGVFDLWACADKALCNAQNGLLDDAAYYLHEAEDALKKASRR